MMRVNLQPLTYYPKHKPLPPGSCSELPTVWQKAVFMSTNVVYRSALSQGLQRELLRTLIERQDRTWAVLEYLAWAESAEQDRWLKDDIRLAWITVLLAARGYPEPWELAFWQTFGKRSHKLIPEFVARAERARTFGDLHNWWAEEITKARANKKPAQSEKLNSEGGENVA